MNKAELELLWDAVGFKKIVGMKETKNGGLLLLVEGGARITIEMYTEYCERAELNISVQTNQGGYGLLAGEEKTNE